MQPLRRDEEVDPAVARRNRQPALGPERRLVLHPGLVVAVDPHVGRSGVDVAVGDVHVAQHVAEVVQAPCARIERELHVGERLERLVVDADQAECGTCALGAVGGHERDGFALVTHLVAGQHGLVGDLEAERGAAGDVRGGQDGVHARRAERLGDVDAADAGGGVGAPQRDAEDHPGRREVAAVDVLAGRLRDAVDPACTLAHPPGLTRHGRHGRLSSARRARREDLAVARAAADVAGEGLAQVMVRWVRVALEQVGDGDDEAGDAVAALHRAGVEKRLLHRVERSVGERRRRADCGAVDLCGRHEAGTDELVVEPDRARAALALLAAVLDGDHLELVAQKSGEAHQRVDVGNALRAVDGESDDHAAILPRAASVQVSARRTSTSTARRR